MDERRIHSYRLYHFTRKHKKGINLQQFDGINSKSNSKFGRTDFNT